LEFYIILPKWVKTIMKALCIAQSPAGRERLVKQYRRDRSVTPVTV
jgi:hypothetical protein